MQVLRAINTEEYRLQRLHRRSILSVINIHDHLLFNYHFVITRTKSIGQ